MKCSSLKLHIRLQFFMQRAFSYIVVKLHFSSPLFLLQGVDVGVNYFVRVLTQGAWPLNQQGKLYSKQPTVNATFRPIPVKRAQGARTNGVRLRGLLRQAVQREEIDLAAPLEQRGRQIGLLEQDLHRQHDYVSNGHFVAFRQEWLVDLQGVAGNHQHCGRSVSKVSSARFMATSSI